MVFTVSTRRYVGNQGTIVNHDEDGHEIPVMHILPGQTGFPGSVKNIAANLASILNGNEPLHEIDIGTARIFWKRNENGCELRLLEDGQHISKPSAVLYAPDANADYLPERLASAMPLLCESFASRGQDRSPGTRPRFDA